MTTLNHQFFFLIFFLITSVSCTKTTETDPASSLPKAQDIPLSGGTWKTSCMAAISGQSLKIQYQFISLDSSYTSTLDLYSDSNCSMSIVTIVNIGTYTLGSPQGTSDGLFKPTEVDYYSVSQIDFTNKGITITPSSSAQVNYLNMQNFCGRNSWALNTPIDISGLTCNGSHIPDIGSIDYDIAQYYFSVKSNSFASATPGNLYFGLSEAGADGTSATSRRKSFNGNIIYRKQ